MTIEQIKHIQNRIDTPADGIWGPKSQAAVKQYLKSLMPAVNPWPTQGNVSKFFGNAGDESNLTNLDVSHLGVMYEGTVVHTIRCHKLVANSLGRILNKIYLSPFKGILEQYAGCFNYRPMRGSNSYSMHAYGIAIDFDPDTNGMHDKWPVQATMPLEIMEFFAAEGWKSAGANWGFDAMHFQATC